MRIRAQNAEEQRAVPPAHVYDRPERREVVGGRHGDCSELREVGHRRVEVGRLRRVLGDLGEWIGGAPLPIRGLAGPDTVLELFPRVLYADPAEEKHHRARASRYVGA